MSHSRQPSSRCSRPPHEPIVPPPGHLAPLLQKKKKNHLQIAYHGQFHNKTKRDKSYKLLNPLCRYFIRISDQRNRQTLPTSLSGRLFFHHLSLDLHSSISLLFRWRRGPEIEAVSSVCGWGGLPTLFEKVAKPAKQQTFDNAGYPCRRLHLQLNGLASRHSTA